MLPKYQGKPLSSVVKLKFREWKRRCTRPLHRPSFYHRLDYRRYYIRAIAAEQGVSREVFPEFTKLRGRSVAERAGVNVPRLLAGPISLNELDLDAYGDRFVIKPDWGKSSRGVVVLQRREDGRFRDLISGTTLDGEGVRARVLEGMTITKRDSSDRLLVEESIASSDLRPQEWKVFSFNGRVGIIQQMDRNSDQTRVKLYSADGASLGRLRTDVTIVDDLEPPRSLDEIVRAAEAISAEVPTGFIRVDLFERENGQIVFGELCMGPGGDLFFSKGWDRRLGRMWDEADKRLIAKRQAVIP